MKERPKNMKFALSDENTVVFVFLLSEYKEEMNRYCGKAKR